jgi:hypothetical protein
VAISADGVTVTRMTSGATPMSLALLVQAGDQTRVLRLPFPRLGAGDAARVLYKGRSQDVRMSAAVMESIGVFGLDSALFVDETGSDRRRRSPTRRRHQREHSRPLVDHGGGPMLTVFRSIRGRPYGAHM